MYYPTLKEARALAQSGPYGQVPVTRELLSDFITPIQALRILRSQDNHCFLLESAADSQGWGRYSFLGFEPSLEVTCKDGIVQLKSETGETETRFSAPGPVLRDLLARYKSPRLQGLPPPAAGPPDHPGEAPVRQGELLRHGGAGQALYPGGGHLPGGAV